MFREFNKVGNVWVCTVREVFGSAVLEFMASHGYKADVRMLGIPDRLVEHGSLRELHRECGYDATGIANGVRELMKNDVKVGLTIGG